MGKRLRILWKLIKGDGRGIDVMTNPELQQQFIQAGHEKKKIIGNIEGQEEIFDLLRRQNTELTKQIIELQKKIAIERPAQQETNDFLTQIERYESFKDKIRDRILEELPSEGEQEIDPIELLIPIITQKLNGGVTNESKPIPSNNGVIAPTNHVDNNIVPIDKRKVHKFVQEKSPIKLSKEKIDEVLEIMRA